MLRNENIFIKFCLKYIFFLSLSGLMFSSCTSTLKTESQADRNAYKKAIMDNINEFRTCYKELNQRLPETEGKLVLGFDINPKSDVENIVVDKSMSTLTDESFVSCMSNTLRKADFPAASKDQLVSIKYPWVFVKTIPPK